MKLKKLFSAAIAAFIIGAAFPAAVPYRTAADQAYHSTVVAGDLTFYKYSDHVELASASAAKGDVSVPARISGLPATVIAGGAFSGAGVTSVTVPDSYKTIEKNAFAKCSKLSEITILGKECNIDESSTTISDSVSSDGSKGSFKGTISGYKGSTAEKYALKNGYSFKVLSDAVTTSSSTTTLTTTTTTTTTTAKPTTTTTTAIKPAEQGKPVFRMSSTQVYHDLSHGSHQHISLSVEGADGLYCDTLIYVYYDKRLTLGEAVPGAAVSKLTTGQYVGDTGDFIVLNTAGSENAGRDGIMWDFDFIVPEDTNVGDVFEINIGASKYGEIQPLFTDFEYDSKGTAMTKYIFTEGLASGKIEVIPNPPYSLGDVNNDKLIDSVDASAVLAEYASLSGNHGTTFIDARQLIAADVNRDNKADSVDASLILAYYAYISGNNPFCDLESYLQKMNEEKRS
ncbi:dockerin type I domain-containing protein [Ruminococcus flavefaciens]|uniref:Dockerin domain-containing protein n=1 Tax=Ruminococcus flavefaciens 007c TaxID=1341157 RepID=W7UBP1_RUMFL|nr:dockerin type I domain-containing protein [Ruminococcus flavefaciens]EWM52511.1 hypothetical protein RF007C_08215 [Ruminococcus flavefaciens 007c]